MDKMNNNNNVTICGEITGELRFCYEIYGESFYETELLVSRLSGVIDKIPVIISERLVDVTQNYDGQYVNVYGQFRSYNNHEGEKPRLILSMFVREIEFAEKLIEDVNQIFLDGYICKEPVYRTTPYGREIGDLLIAVNRSYGKSDYIPCVTWGRNARYASGLAVGAHIQIHGRIQSRQYEKKISETESETRIAYEVSVSKISVVE